MVAECKVLLYANSARGRRLTHSSCWYVDVIPKVPGLVDMFSLPMDEGGRLSRVGLDTQ